MPAHNSLKVFHHILKRIGKLEHALVVSFTRPLLEFIPAYLYTTDYTPKYLYLYSLLKPTGHDRRLGPSEAAPRFRTGPVLKLNGSNIYMKKSIYFHI